MKVWMKEMKILCWIRQLMHLVASWVLYNNIRRWAAWRWAAYQWRKSPGRLLTTSIEPLPSIFIAGTQQCCRPCSQPESLNIVTNFCSPSKLRRSHSLERKVIKLPRNHFKSFEIISREEFSEILLSATHTSSSFFLLLQCQHHPF